MRDENPLLRGVGYNSGTTPCSAKEFHKILTNFVCAHFLLRPVVWVCLPHVILLHTLSSLQGKNRVFGNCLAYVDITGKNRKKEDFFFSMKQNPVKFAVESADQVKLCLHLT